MKSFVLLLIACLGWVPCSLQAQNAAAELALERKANEERFNMLNAKVASIVETQEVLLRRISDLEQRYKSLGREIDKLKDESAHASTRQVTREELKTLIEKLQEIDKKREDDKKLILDSIKDLAKVPAPPASTHSKPSLDRSEVAETVLYKVEPGNRLVDIINSYNEEFAKQGLGRITLEQVKKANPGLNPNKIGAGQPIKIPVPPKK